MTGNLDGNHGPNSEQLAAILRGFTVKQPGLVVSRADKIFISALLADSVVRNTIFINNHSKTPFNSSFPPVKFDTLRFCQILTITN